MGCWGGTRHDEPWTDGSDCYVTTRQDRMSLDLAGMWHHTKWPVKQLSLGDIVHLVGHVVGSRPTMVQPRQDRTYWHSAMCVPPQKGRGEGGREGKREEMKEGRRRREGGKREGEDFHFSCGVRNYDLQNVRIPWCLVIMAKQILCI